MAETSNPAPNHVTEGYFKVFRSVFSHDDPLWKLDEPRSFTEAWLYVIFRTRYSPEEGQVLVAGQIAPIYRGEVHLSHASLATAMRWTNSDGSVDVRKGRRFMETAHRLGRIRPTDRRKLGIYKVINYETYNPLPSSFYAQVDAQNDLQNDAHIKNKEQRVPPLPPKGGVRASHDRLREAIRTGTIRKAKRLATGIVYDSLTVDESGTIKALQKLGQGGAVPVGRRELGEWEWLDAQGKPLNEKGAFE